MTPTEILETVKKMLDMVADRNDVYISVFMGVRGANISINPVTGGAEDGK